MATASAILAENQLSIDSVTSAKVVKRLTIEKPDLKIDCQLDNNSQPRGNLMVEPSRDELGQALLDIGNHQDQAAFETVYKYFAGRVKSFLLGKGMEDSTAEELMQEIMLTVWRRAESYDPAKAAASTWIFTIARNRRIDYLRGNSRIEVELDDAMLERAIEQHNTNDTLEYKTTLAQESHKLFSAMENLPPEQQQVMHLSYFRGQSHGDIAQWLGLPVGTVKSRIRLALQNVRTNMDADNSERDPFEN